MNKKVPYKKKQQVVMVWMPVKLLRAMDQLAAVCDLDRSKFIREAVRRMIDNAKPRA